MQAYKGQTTDATALILQGGSIKRQLQIHGSGPQPVFIGPQLAYAGLVVQRQLLAISQIIQSVQAQVQAQQASTPAQFMLRRPQSKRWALGFLMGVLVQDRQTPLHFQAAQHRTVIGQLFLSSLFDTCLHHIQQRILAIQHVQAVLIVHTQPEQYDGAVQEYSTCIHIVDTDEMGQGMTMQTELHESTQGAAGLYIQHADPAAYALFQHQAGSVLIQQ